MQLGKTIVVPYVRVTDSERGSTMKFKDHAGMQRYWG